MASATPSQSERRYLWTLASWLFAALCLFAAIHLLAPVCNSTAVAPISTTIAPIPAPPGAEPATVATNELALATARRQAEETKALARIRLQRLRQSADDAIAVTRQFEREHDEWAALVPALLTDERGKRLSTDPDAVQAIRSISQVQRAPRTLGEQVRQNVATLIEPVDAALKADDSAYTPSDALSGQLEEETKRTNVGLEDIRRVRRQIDGLILATATRAPGEPLTVVIQRMEAAEARLQANAVAAERTTATSEVHQQIAQAEGEKVREIGDAEAARVQAEANAEQSRIRAEALRVREQGERDRLLKLAKDPAVQARFTPFLSPGRRYPARYEGSVRWLERKPWGRTPPGPVTLKELSTGGVLDSLQNFVVAAASSKSKTGAQNDRPHWPMPTTPAEWNACRADFALFQELAPIWVELQIVPAN